MKKKRISLKAGIVAFSVAALVPAAKLDASAEEATTEIVAEEAAAEADEAAAEEAKADEAAAEEAKADEAAAEEAAAEADEAAAEEAAAEADEAAAEEAADTAQEATTEADPAIGAEEVASLTELTAEGETKEGWVEEEDGWRYYVDGAYVKSCVMKIGKYGYAFDWYGIMATSGKTSIWDQETYKTNYYYADEKGHLLASQWIEGEYDSWYYAGADFKLATGIQTINGKTYAFYDYGSMMVNTSCTFEEGNYAVDGKGIATLLKEGWNLVDGKYYYVQDGVLQKNVIIKIGNTDYFFMYNGVMLDDSSYTQYIDGKRVSYRAKAGGALLKSAWYTSNSETYYYGSDHMMVTGVETINGKQYAFNEYGEMYRSSAIVIDGTGYVVDADGIAVAAIKGWNKVGTKYYYFDGTEFCNDEVRKIGNAYYGFGYGSDCYMYDDVVFNVDGIYYRAKAGGKLYCNEWFNNYWYGADAGAANGLQTVNGKKYYFNYYGEAISELYVSLEEGDTYTLYYAAKNCSLSKVTKDGFYYGTIDRSDMYAVSGGKLLINEWKKYGGKYYYFGDDGLAYQNTTAEINGKWYSFNPDGTMKTRGWIDSGNIPQGSFVTSSGALAVGSVKIDNVWYYFDEYGDKMIGLVTNEKGSWLYGTDGQYIGKASGTGWNKIGSAWYYAMDDGSLAQGYQTINGNGYYFQDGRMMVNVIEYADGGQAIFGADGKMVKQGWASIDGAWYYVEDSKLVTGSFKTISGKKYRFNWNGVMETGDFQYSEKAYSANKSGVITAEKEFADGWTLFGGDYYYYKSGKPYTGWVGDYYISYGVMQRNEIADDYWLETDGKYRKTAGWVYRGSGSDKWNTGVYVKSNRKVAKNEWLKISGSWYYFNHYGNRQTGLQYIDGVWYILDWEGALVKTLGAKLPDGWVQAGQEWYYFKDGETCNGELKLGSTIYYFNESRMVASDLGYNSGTSFYYDANGKAEISNKGWKQIEYRWFYFDANNRATINGWVNVGDKQYYMAWGQMATGTRVINEKLVTFASSGALTKVYDLEDGWHKVNGADYYFRNGWLMTSSLVVSGGKTYLLGYDGKLVRNGSSYADGNDYYADANGVILTNTWKAASNSYGKCYYGADGKRLTGIQKIDGKIYYFD